MQLNTTRLAGGIRNLIIADLALIPQPLNTIAFEGIINQTHTQLDFTKLDNALILRNLKPAVGNYALKHLPRRGYDVSITLQSYGMNHAYELQLYKIEQMQLVALVNLYAHPVDQYIIVGDKHKPVKIKSLEVDSGNKNQDIVTINMKLNVLLRNIPPSYFGHL